MEELTGWFQRQAKRQHGVLYLETALLSDRFWPYAVLRLRYFMGAYLAETLLHGLKIVLLVRAFAEEQFIAIALLHACSTLVNSFWWGCLEVMRGRIRHFYRVGKPFLIAREIGRWLSFAGQLAGATAIAALAWVVWRVGWQERGFGPADLYVFAMLLGLATTWVTRCYHSGVYALRRIYRPLPAIVALEASAFLAVLTLWFWVGAWSFAVAAMLSTFVAATLTLYTSGRMYRFFGFNVRRYLDLGQRRAPWRDESAEALSGGLSFAVTRLDALVIVALLATSSGHPEGRLIAFLLFALSPTLHAGFEWAQLFYFDLKRLEDVLFAHLRQRFERCVWGLAWVLGLLFGGLASVIGIALLPDAAAPLLAVLVPLFVARSLLAKAQVHAFARRDYWPLFTSGVLAICGFSLAGLATVHGSLRFVFMTAACLIAVVPIRARRERPGSASSRGEPLSLAEWASRLREVKAPVRISVLQMGRERRPPEGEEAKWWWHGDGWRQRWLADQLAWKLRWTGSLMLAGKGRLAWYERVDRRPAVTEDWLLIHGGGRVARVYHTGVCSNGVAALDAACRLGYLGVPSGVQHDLGASVRASDARVVFRDLLPDGVVYDPEEGTPPFFDVLSPDEKRVILLDAVAFARGLERRSKNSRFDVTAFEDTGGLRLIFVADAKADRRVRARWRTLARRFNVHAALNGSARETAQPHVHGDRAFVTFNRTHP